MGISELGNHGAVAPARQRRGRGFGLALAAALSVALALLPAAVPQEALAKDDPPGICKSRKLLKQPCVNGADVKDKELTALDVLNEAGASFDLGPDAVIDERKRTYAKITLVPTKKPKRSLHYVFITYSAVISTISAASSTVHCFVDSDLSNFPGAAFASVDLRRRPVTSIGASVTRSLGRKDFGKSKSVKFKLMCEKIAGSRVFIEGPSITAVYYP